MANLQKPKYLTKHSETEIEISYGETMLWVEIHDKSIEYTDYSGCGQPLRMKEIDFEIEKITFSTGWAEAEFRATPEQKQMIEGWVETLLDSEKRELWMGENEKLTTKKLQSCAV